MKTVKGKIILVDSEKYQKALLEIALLQKNWKVNVEYFSSPEEAFEYLKGTSDDIFLIISAMKFLQMDGLDFKKAIDNDEGLRKRAIPFIFASNLQSNLQITKAYEYRVQGYFKKPINIDEQAEMMNVIIKYWIMSKHPSHDSDDDA